MYLGPHRSKIEKRIPITFNYVKRGTIIEAKYKGLERLSPKSTMYLVLSPNYMGYMHVLDLTFVHPRFLLPENVGKIMANIKTEEFRNKTYQRLLFEDRSQDVYNKVIKGLFPTAYRTLKRTKTANQGFFGISLIDYKFE